jgi:hypothetical protein
MHVVVRHPNGLEQVALSGKVAVEPLVLELREVFLLPLLEDGILHQLLGVGSLFGIHMYHQLQ